MEEPSEEEPRDGPVAEDHRPTARVERGECNLSGIPESMRVELDDDAAARLVNEVERWLNEDWSSFEVVPRAGVFFAKSEDDLGADPPHPTATQAQGKHACGLEAEWLAAAAQRAMRLRGLPDGNAPIRCQGNVCCYAALGEYDSAGGVVFAPQGEDRFRIQAVYEVADNGTLGADYITEQYAIVDGYLDRLRRRTCRSEPENPRD
jgi:hypothetical protein